MIYLNLKDMFFLQNKKSIVRFLSIFFLIPSTLLFFVASIYSLVNFFKKFLPLNLLFALLILFIAISMGFFTIRLILRKRIKEWGFISLGFGCLFILFLLINMQMSSRRQLPNFKVPILEEAQESSLSQQKKRADKPFLGFSFTDMTRDIDSKGVMFLNMTMSPVAEIEINGSSEKADNLEVEISTYKVDKEVLLNFLLHDQKNNQLNKEVDLKKIKLIAKSQEKLNLGEKRKVNLPINEAGIWYLEIKSNHFALEKKLFVVRSSIGAVLKEGDGEFILWGQDLFTKKSLNGGNFRIYSLTDRASMIADATLNNEGIAKAELDPQADVGFLEYNNELAIIPINLTTLNEEYSYSYKNFQTKEKQAAFFIFTDRPLYRPGDKAFFKSIIREDDDVRFKIPTGLASVKVYRGYYNEDEKPIFEKSYEINSAGGIYGEIDLPEDIQTGYYQIYVDLDPSSDDYRLQSYSYFQVEYFRKPEYSLEILTPQKEFIAGDKASFKIYGRYFYGQPLGGQEVSYKVYSTDAHEYSYYSDLNFQENNKFFYGYYGGQIIKEGTVQLNEKGEAEVEMAINLIAGDYKNQIFSIEAEFIDSSGNPIYERKNIFVYSGEYGIYRETSNAQFFANDKAKLDFILKSKLNQINLNGISLKAKIHHTIWKSYYTADKKYPSYKKEERDLEELNLKSDTSGRLNFSFIPSESGLYDVTFEGRDQRGNLVKKVFSFYVYSRDAAFIRSVNDDTEGLSLQIDKENYNHTDSVKVTIVSDIPDRDVLLSFDRARVNRFQIIRVEGKSKTVELPLEATDIPNIYLRVSSFSDRWLNSDRAEIHVSTDPKKILVKIDPERKTYGPGDTVQAKIKTTDINGNPISVDTAVWSVDKAIFELAEQRLDILSEFWYDRYDDTNESHSFEGINMGFGAEMGGGCFAPGTQILMANGKDKSIEDIKVGDKILTRLSSKNPNLVKTDVKEVYRHEVNGYLIINQNLKVTPAHYLWVNGSWQEASQIEIGDYLLDQDNHQIEVSSIEWQKGKFAVYNLNIKNYHTFFANDIWVHNEKGDDARTVFKDTAYWNPSIQTDVNGEATVNFKLPDNLTTWVIAAVSADSETRVGQNTEEIIVTKNVIVRPILPNILQKDDEVILSAIVQNFTDQDYQFDVNLQFDSGEVKPLSVDDFLIKAKDSKQFYWQVFPKTENSEAKLTFTSIAKDNNQITDTVVQKIVVQPFGFWQKEVSTGNGPKEFFIQLLPNSDKEKSDIRLSLASTLLGTLPEAMRYLAQYPYGCVEQITSRFVPAVIAKANPEIFEQAIADKNIEEIINESILRLVKLQSDDGGWGWWHENKSNPFITAYVVEYLNEAKKLGFQFNENILNEAEKFLKDALNSKNNVSEKEKIAAAYGLSFLNINEIKNNFNNFDNLSPDILSLAVMVNIRKGDKNPSTNGLSKLINLAESINGSTSWVKGESSFFGSRESSTAFAIRAIVEGRGDRQTAVSAIRYLTQSRQKEKWQNTFATAQVIRAVVDFSKTGEDLAPNYRYSVKMDGQTIVEGSVIDYRKPLKEIIIKGKDIKQEGSKIVVAEVEGEGEIYSTLIVNQFNTNKEAKSLNQGLEVKREYINDKGDNYNLAVGDVVTVRLTVDGWPLEERYGMVYDQLPSGMIPINNALDNENQSNIYQSYGREITQNGMILSLSYIPLNNVYTYKARLISAGNFNVMPASAELMYNPEIRGYSKAESIKIETESKIIPSNIIKNIVGEKVKTQITKKYGWLGFIISLVVMTLLVWGIITLIKFIKRNKNKEEKNI